MPSTRVRVWVMSLTFAAVVMVLSGGAVSVAAQVVFAARLAPVDRRRAGRGSPPFSRGRGSRRHTRGTSRARRPRSALRAGCGATDRRFPTVASGPGVDSRSVRSRTPAPGAGVARRCPGAGRTGCPAGTTGRPPASALETARARAAATVRSLPTSRRPRSTAESSQPPNDQIVTTDTPDQDTSARSCYELIVRGDLLVPAPAPAPELVERVCVTGQSSDVG